jgi:hypothetical protein
MRPQVTTSELFCPASSTSPVVRRGWELP